MNEAKPDEKTHPCDRCGKPEATGNNKLCRACFDHLYPTAEPTPAPRPQTRGIGTLEGTLFKGPGPLSEAELELLTGEAEAFLRAGGTFSWTEWRLFTAQERECAIAAGNRVALERALLLAAANQGPDAAAQLAAPLDGGQMIADNVVAAAAQRISQAGKSPQPTTITRGPKGK